MRRLGKALRAAALRMGPNRPRFSREGRHAVGAGSKDSSDSSESRAALK